MLHVHVHARYPCPYYMSMSVLHFHVPSTVHVIGACRSPCCEFMFILHVHVHTTCPCPCCSPSPCYSPCPCCSPCLCRMSNSMLHVQLSMSMLQVMSMLQSNWPCPCCMSNWPCPCYMANWPCPYCGSMSISMMHVHVHVHAAFPVHAECPIVRVHAECPIVRVHAGCPQVVKDSRAHMTYISGHLTLHKGERPFSLVQRQVETRKTSNFPCTLL
jgi:hypothetical protein